MKAVGLPRQTISKKMLDKCHMFGVDSDHTRVYCRSAKGKKRNRGSSGYPEGACLTTNQCGG